jgi:hypothetical protein
MERLEAQRRLFDAIQTLMRHGWTSGNVNAMLDGRHREEAVEIAERHAAAYKDAPCGCYPKGNAGNCPAPGCRTQFIATR